VCEASLNSIIGNRFGFENAEHNARGLILNEAADNYKEYMSVYRDISHTTNRSYSSEYLHIIYKYIGRLIEGKIFMTKMFQALPFTNSKSKQTASKMGECLSQFYMHS
jgi:hypothetical protein